MAWKTALRALASLVAVAVAVALAIAPHPSAQTPTASARQPKLVLAVQPTSTPEQLSADAKELREFLSQRLHREVEIVFPMTYAGVVEALRFGHAQAAFMSAWPAQLAVKHARAEVALAEVREVVIGQEKKAETYYFSYWVVAKDSPVQRLEQLRGKRAVFPSPLSTSGYVAPSPGSSSSASCRSRRGRRPTRRRSSATSGSPAATPRAGRR